MKVGDLVKPGKKHGLRNHDGRSRGLIVEHLPRREGFREGVTVQWNDGDVELEIPDWLETVSESR